MRGPKSMNPTTGTDRLMPTQHLSKYINISIHSFPPKRSIKLVVQRTVSVCGESRMWCILVVLYAVVRWQLDDCEASNPSWS